MPATAVHSTEVTVDIRTRFIQDETKVYILFPGRGYRYADTMRETGLIFLDIPGFPIFSDGDVPGRSDIVKSIVLSERVRTWHNHNRPPDKEPDRRLDRITDFKETPWRRQFAAIIENFFTIPKQGDIFIVPGRMENSPVLFGEVVDEPGSCVALKSPFEFGEIIPARRVHWIKEMPRRTLPRWLDKKFPSPNPLRQVERSQFQYIFDMMYERYYFDGRFAVKIATESKEFSALDSYLLNQVVLYVAALHENYHESNIKDFALKSISDVVAHISFSDDIPELRVVIQSPGFIVIDAKNVIPIIASIFMTIGTGGGACAEPPSAKIVNSADQSALSKQCVGDIEMEVNQDIEMMGYKRWQELCRAEREARQRALLNPGMTVK